MIISIFVFTMALIVFGITCYKKEITYPIVVKMVGLVLIMYAAITYTAKLSGYSALLWEYSVYLWFYKVKISIDMVYIVGTIGVSLYMLSGFLEAYICTKKKYVWMFSLLIIAFVVINSPYVMEKIYLKLILQEDGTQKVEYARHMIAIYGSLVMAFSSLYPYYLMYRRYKQTNLFVKKKKIAIMAISCVMTDVLFAVSVFMGKLYNYMFWGMSLLCYPMNIVQLEGKAIYLATVIFATTALVFLIFKFAPVTNYLKYRTSEKYLFDNSRDVFMILHAYKNIFVAISKYANYKDEEYSFIGATEKRLDSIGELAKEQLDKLNETLNIFKLDIQSFGDLEYISLSNCVNQAVKRSAVDLKVKNVIVDIKEDAKILSSEYHLVECMVCIINNACEAVLRNEGEKIVKITVGRENGNAYFEVYDNGCGIDWRNKNKIYKPFYSTKRGTTNYGMGLSYVKKLVEILGGNLFIRSRVNSFTDVQITMKARGEGSNYGKNKSSDQ